MTDRKSTREPQYHNCLDVADSVGIQQFGLMANQAWHDDPKRLAFTFARYKFVGKMLSGKTHVLEVGCADAFGTRIVLQEVKAITAVDFDPIFVADAKRNMTSRWHFEVLEHDILKSSVPGSFGGAFSLDVLEHISASQEDTYLRNIMASLTGDGVLIIGTPSLESQPHASPQSKQGHINCKSGTQLKELLSRYFHNVFIFSMNDEVVHTGFYPMAHYLFAVCCMKRR